MKVFKMNECDWACAETEEQVKDYYHELTGIDMTIIEEDFEGEVSLSDTMYISTDDLPEDELSLPQTKLEYYGDTWVLRTFEWVIKNEKITEPCIISSTEY
jgi:hypothetical protein